MTPSISPRSRLLGSLFLAAGVLSSTRALANQEDSPRHFGAFQSTLSDLERPSAITFDPLGNLWVADMDGSRIAAYDPKGTLVHSISWPRTSHPSGLLVDSEERIWISDQWNHQVFLVNQFGQVTKAFGDKGEGLLLAPGGIALHADELLVADSGHGRVVSFGMDGSLLKVIGKGLLENPRALATDPLGNIAVVDSGLAQVIVFDSEGQELHRFGDWGWFRGLLSDPSDIAFHAVHSGAESPGRWYVADRKNQRIQVFNHDGSPLYTTGLHAVLPREGEGMLHYPTSIALDPQGTRLAIAEPMDGRIQIFGPKDGAEPSPDPRRQANMQPAPHYGQRWALGHNYLAIPVPEEHRVRIYDMRLFPDLEPVQVIAIGGYGQNLGFFRNPEGLDWHADSPTLFIADRGNHRVVSVALDLSQDAPLVQDPKAARFVHAFDLEAWNAGLTEDLRLAEAPDPLDLQHGVDGEVFLLCASNRVILGFDKNWQPTLRFGHTKESPLLAPVAIARHAKSGQFAVADEGFGMVAIFDEQGSLLRYLGQDELRRPVGVAYLKDGTLLVTDRRQCELFTFAPDGTFVDRRFRPGIGRDGLSGPTDLVIDPEGRQLVLDHGNHRAMVFDEKGQWLTAFGSRLYTKPARLPNAPKHAEESE